MNKRKMKKQIKLGNTDILLVSVSIKGQLQRFKEHRKGYLIKKVIRRNKPRLPSIRSRS